MSQRDRAAHFRQLHEKRPLVLPNAWDAASARVIEMAGRRRLPPPALPSPGPMDVATARSYGGTK